MNKKTSPNFVGVSNMTEEQFDKLLGALHSISKELRLRNRLKSNKMMLKLASNTAQKDEARKEIENTASVLKNF